MGSCPHRCKTIHLLRQQWWSRPYCRNVKPKLNQKPKPIQMLGMDMDTDTDHTGAMVDTVDTTTENRLLQYKYRILPTGCGYLKNKTKNINKMSKKKKTYIYPELSVKQEYL